MMEMRDIDDLNLTKLPKMKVDMTIRDENMARIMRQEYGSLEDTVRGMNATLEKMGAGKLVYVKPAGGKENHK